MSFSQIKYAKKEIAFAKWRTSGYRDLEAWNEFIRLFVELNA
jgi:hypothetical protein